MTIKPCDFDRISWEERPQAQRIAAWMQARHRTAHILDVGCGPGLYVEEMRSLGLSAFGVDNDIRTPTGPGYFACDLSRECAPIFVSAEPQALPFDVVLSLEVGEHIPEHIPDVSGGHIPGYGADAYVGTIEGCGADIVYFSAARPGQGGEGHINCRYKPYWVEKFHAAGFWLDPDATEEWLNFIRSGPHMGWLTQNGMVFRRG